MFFSKKDAEAKPAAAVEEEVKEAKTSEDKKETASTTGDKKKTAAKKEETSSSSESDGEESLSKEDIQKIKKLIADQDKEIEALKETAKQYKDKLIYQLAENDNTIKRYKKEVDSTREYAITKFAKDLLDVRDNLELASQHIKKINIEDTHEVEVLKKNLTDVVFGMNMTSHVMDQCLKRFHVV